MVIPRQVTSRSDLIEHSVTKWEAKRVDPSKQCSRISLGWNKQKYCKDFRELVVFIIFKEIT